MRSQTLRRHASRYRHRVTLAVLLAVLGALPAGANARQNPPDAAHLEALQQLQRIWRERTFLIVGELHGTEETPRLVSWLLANAPADRKLLLALELPDSEAPRITRYLDLATATPDPALLTDSAFWKDTDWQDGRASVAMRDLIATVRTLRASGREVRIAPFISDAGASSDAHDKRMANSIAQAHATFDPDLTLVLVGNHHSRVKATEGDAGNEPLGWHLARFDPLSIAVFANSGTFWACTGEDTFTCGVTPLPPNPRDTGLTLEDGVSERGYHGMLILEAFNASPPAATPPAD